MTDRRKRSAMPFEERKDSNDDDDDDDDDNDDSNDEFDEESSFDDGDNSIPTLDSTIVSNTAEAASATPVNNTSNNSNINKNNNSSSSSRTPPKDSLSKGNSKRSLSSHGSKSRSKDRDKDKDLSSSRRKGRSNSDHARSRRDRNLHRHTNSEHGRPSSRGNRQESFRSYESSRSKNSHRSANGSKSPSTSNNRKSPHNNNKNNTSASKNITKTPSRSQSLTIGHASYSQQGFASSAGLPDLHTLSQAYESCTDTKLREGLEQLMNSSKQEFGHTKRVSNASAPVTWKTSFEVDAPRETANKKLVKTSTTDDDDGDNSEADPSLSEEQNAWAGIDALLSDTVSVDGSYAISTTEILPRSIVRAMKRDLSRNSFETLMHDSFGSDNMSRASKLALESLYGKEAQKNQDAGNCDNSMPSLETAKEDDLDDDENEKDDEITALRDTPIVTRTSINRINNESSGKINNGGLFDLFHWSEKDNVDELRQRKTKLNKSNRRVTLKVDDNSLPSLSSFKDEELGGGGGGASSSRSGTSTVDWDVLNEEEDQSSNESEGSEEEDDDDDEYQDDNGIDEFEAHRQALRSMPIIRDDLPSPMPFSQQNKVVKFPPVAALAPPPMDRPNVPISGEIPDLKDLPPIGGDDIPTLPVRKGRKKKGGGGTGGNNSSEDELGDGDGDDESTSPTSVVMEQKAPTDELPSLSELSGSSSNHSRLGTPIISNKKGLPREKKEKMSLSLQFKKSFKKIKEKGISLTKQGSPAGRSEEKYFPTSNKDNAKLFSAERCLLSQGDDGVNWD